MISMYHFLSRGILVQCADMPHIFWISCSQVESFIDMAFDNASNQARIKLDEDQKLIDSIGLPPHVSKR
jgi:hypothetical protein